MSKFRFWYSVSALQVLFVVSVSLSSVAITNHLLHAGDSKKIDQVLAAEAAGKPINRRESLADQSDEVAQWQSGRILIEGKWVELEAMKQHKLAPQLEEYLKRRDAQELDIEGHRQLALWCQSHQLPEMAKVHWKAVAAVAVDNEQAHKALGHKKFEGRWISSEELALAAQEKEQLKSGLKKWLPQLRKIANNLNSSDHKNKLAALRQLENINSKDAVGALKVAAMRVDPAVGVPLVSKIKAIRSKEACLALCEIALVNPNCEVGRLAVSGLKQYDQHFYVPELLQLLETPVSMAQDLLYMPNGSLVVRYAYSKENMLEKLVQRFSKLQLLLTKTVTLLNCTIQR